MTELEKAKHTMARNTIIAIFMGIQKYRDYDLSWDAIHPVVEKIFSLSPNKISPLRLADLQFSWNRRNLKEVFNSVIKCIDYYYETEKM